MAQKRHKEVGYRKQIVCQQCTKVTTVRGEYSMGEEAHGTMVVAAAAASTNFRVE